MRRQQDYVGRKARKGERKSEEEVVGGVRASLREKGQLRGGSARQSGGVEVNVIGHKGGIKMNGKRKRKKSRREIR